jgi:hypothetical protein
VKRALLLGIALFLGCSESSPGRLGAEQPIRVRNARAQFFAGELPHDGGGPKIVTLDSANNKVRPGFVGKVFTGNAEKSAASVAIHFKDLGSGYWVVPVEDIDPLQDQISWRLDLDISPDAPIGPHPFELVAFDGDARPGPLYEQSFEITSNIPKGHVVFTLKWNTAADLDLVTFTPDLKRVDSKHPSTSTHLDAGVDPSDGVLDHDSNANCVRDGYDQEDLVFTGNPRPGKYQLGATMVSGCGAPATTYTITVTVDGVVQAEASGRLLEAYDTSAGAAPVAPILTIEL